jgi:formate hydrogenlyase subunit 3/multisubunit Na+/H+ antiporter MnhD subunit
VSGLLILLLVLPLGGALATALGKKLPRLGPAAGLLVPAACLGLLVPLAPAALAALEGGPALVYELGRWSEPVGIALYFDGLAWLTSAVGLLVALCALLFAVSEGGHPPSFYFFFLLLIFGMQGVILTGDLFNLFVFLEVLSIASYILIAGAGKPRSLVASFRYLMISSLGIAFFLLGTFLFYRAAGTLSLRLLGEALAGASPAARWELELAVVCLAVGVGVKASFLPFHTWLPDAHAAAPHPVSAVLSGVMIKVSFLVVWRLLRLFAAADLQVVLLWVGALTALFGVGAAISQVDAKRLLAFHSVSQMGYIVAAFGAGAAATGGAGAAAGRAGVALGASLYHLVSHSLFKSLLFLAVGAVIHLTGERDLRRAARQRPQAALAGRVPVLFALFLAGALSISGLPPFNGYVSKGLVTASLKGQPLAYGLILLAGAGTVASMLKLSGIFFRRRETGPAAGAVAEPAAAPALSSPAAAARNRLPLSMYLPLALLAALCLTTGLLPRPVGGMLAAIALGIRPDRAIVLAPAIAQV